LRRRPPQRSMRVLIAEDDFASRILLDAVLVKWGYEVVPARDGEEAWQILDSETAPPIAILDWMMPKLSGVDLCERVRAQPRELVPYILMLTARAQKDDVTFGLDSGADDYLIKPFDMSELGARLRVARRAIALQRELLDARKAVQYQALHDLSTGALNRGTILGKLSEMLGVHPRLTAMLVAVDGHKGLQEREGADSAESVVRGVVQRLRAEAPDAHIGRYCSDELLVVLPGVASDEAIALAERVKREVASPHFSLATGVPGPIGMSAGIVEWDGSASLELLLCYADSALYAARAVGNTVEAFDFQVSA
jgi:two-component system cell cycle response regulator